MPVEDRRRYHPRRLVLLALSHAKTSAEKAAAERVALGVYGVKAVANDMNVRIGESHERTDTKIAQAVLSALKWNTMVPDEKIIDTLQVICAHHHPVPHIIAAKPDGSRPD